MFLGIIIPLVVITGPVATLLEGLASFGEDGVDAMNIIIWVPVLIMLICLIEGRKLLPKTLDGWTKMLLLRQAVLQLRRGLPVRHGQQQRPEPDQLRGT